MSELFEAVYYASPVPSTLESLTMLSLLFDKIHFPGVYIGSEDLDLKETQCEIARIKKLKPRHIDEVILIKAMQFCLHARHLKDFCVFIGKHGYPGTLEPGAERIAHELEVLNLWPPVSKNHSNNNNGNGKRFTGRC